MPLLKPDCACDLQRTARTVTVFDAEQSVLRSPVYLGIIAKYGHCSRISARSERTFSAVQTSWRSAQSRANSSLREFPANREKYREFLYSGIRKCHTMPPKALILLGLLMRQRCNEQGIFGRYQGI